MKKKKKKKKKNKKERKKKDALCLCLKTEALTKLLNKEFKEVAGKGPWLSLKMKIDNHNITFLSLRYHKIINKKFRFIFPNEEKI